MKKVIWIALTAILIFGISACRNAENSGMPNSKDETFELTLYADLSGGSPDGAIKEKSILLPLNTYPASPSLIGSLLSSGLSDWTGLDFSLNDVRFLDDESVIVDWSKDATLIAGLDNREQKDEFQFFDAVSLNLFMMDSLAVTLKNNMAINNVYYCSDGEPIRFPNPEDMASVGLSELPIDQPYEGSAFFNSHGDGKGDTDVMNMEQAEEIIMRLTQVQMQEIEDDGGKPAYVFKGEGDIGDNMAYFFDLGVNSDEKFTAEFHYAVDEQGDMWEMDIFGDWHPFYAG